MRQALRRIGQGLATAVLLVAGASRAEGQAAAQPPKSEAKASPGIPTKPLRVIRGMLTQLNYSEGTVTVRSGSETLVVNARPQQLALYKPGERATIQYKVYGGIPWMLPASASETRSPLDFARADTVVGVTSEVDKAKGLLRLELAGTEPLTFRAHPLDLGGLLPGQFIALSFSRIGEANWVSSIAPASEKR